MNLLLSWDDQKTISAAEMEGFLSRFLEARGVHAAVLGLHEKCLLKDAEFLPCQNCQALVVLETTRLTVRLVCLSCDDLGAKSLWLLNS